MKCRGCGQENDAESGFCVKCGSRMPYDLERFCTACGAEREPNAVFCSKCGQAFTTSLPAAAPQSRECPVSAPRTAASNAAPSGKILKVAIVLVMACLLLAAGGWAAWFLFRPSPGKVAMPPTVSAEGEREQAFRHFTQATELMEAVEQGQGDENTLIKALEHAEQATLLDPSAAAYWHLLGHVYAQMAEDQMASVMAEEALNKAISLNPENISSRLLLARLLLGRESYALALDHLEWAARKDARLLNSLLVADMSRAYVVDEQAARGEGFFREMRQRRPELSSLRLGLAILLHEQGRKAAALDELQGLLGDGKADADDVAHARKLVRAWQGESS